MTSLSITIDKDEIQKYAERKLTPKELKEVFLTIENDPVLWSEVEKSILSSIEFVRLSNKS